MDRSGFQRLTPVILVLLVVAIAAAALFSLGRNFFIGGGSPADSGVKPINVGKDALTNLSADRSVILTVRGPIVASENFHSYAIIVTPDSRNMTTFKGYVGETVNSVQMNNNSKAYTQFVYALDREKLMNGSPLEGDANDTRGICPGGYLYEFAVAKGQEIVRKLWTTSCVSAKGSLRVSSLQRVSGLFKKQIPEYTKLASKVGFSN